MINDKMDTEEIILDLSTRASNIFILNNGDDSDIVCVSLFCHRSVPNFWQVEFDHWIGGSYWHDKKLSGSLSEGRTLREALVFLDQWLDSREFDVQYKLEDGEAIVESIGFGD